MTSPNGPNFNTAPFTQLTPGSTQIPQGTTSPSQVPAGDTGLGPVDSLSSIFSVFSFITDPGTWKRLGLGLAGIVALFFALRRAGVTQGAANAVKKTAKVVNSAR